MHDILIFSFSSWFHSYSLPWEWYINFADLFKWLALALWIYCTVFLVSISLISALFFIVPYLYFSSVQFSCSVVFDSATPWIAAHQASLSITNSRNLLKLMPIKSVMPSSHLILCHPLTLVLFWSSFSSSNLNEWFRHFSFYTITS